MFSIVDILLKYFISYLHRTILDYFKFAPCPFQRIVIKGTSFEVYSKVSIMNACLCILGKGQIQRMHTLTLMNFIKRITYQSPLEFCG